MLAAERPVTQTLGRSRSSTGKAVVDLRTLCLRTHCFAHGRRAPATWAATPSRHAKAILSRQHLLHPQHGSAVACCSKIAAAGVAAVSSSATSTGHGSSASTGTATVNVPAVAPEHKHLTFLQELRVSDFALVPSAHVCFSPGLNSISGQSGAGKSMLIDALAQLLGAPADSGSVRPPADTAVLEGTWWCAPGTAAAAAELLSAMGMPAKALPGVWGSNSATGAGTIHIRREISCMPAAGSPSGGSNSSSAAGGSTRSRVLVNGSPSSLRVLRALGALLVDVNGQHASLALRDSSQQLQLLDRIAGTTGLAAQLRAQVSRLSQLESLMAQTAALADAADRAALQKKVDLIDRANITPGEEVQLRLRLQAMESRRGCLEAAAAVQTGIAGDGSAAGSASLNDALRLVMSQLRGVISSEEQQLRMVKQQQQQQAEAISSSNGNGKAHASSSSSNSSAKVVAGKADSEDDVSAAAAEEASERTAAVDALHAAYEALEAVGDELMEAQAQLQSYASLAGYSPAAYASMSSRLELIEKLTRSFKVRSSSELLDLAQHWSDELEQYYDSIGQQEAWQAESAALLPAVTSTALQLSAARTAAAGRLAAAVESCLAQLAMSSSKFAVDVAWTPAGKTDQEVGPSSRAVLAPVAAEPAPASSDAQQHDVIGSRSDGHGSESDPSALYKLSPSGLDSVTFLLSAGPAEPLHPLAATASGGEAARIMLALKAAPAAAAAVHHDRTQAAVEIDSYKSDESASSSGSCSSSGNADTLTTSSSSSSTSSSSGLVTVGPPVLVMDELDAGLGSRLGEPVGRLLTRLVGAAGQPPAACQVLVVTHAPQVAAHASHHIQVLKAAADDGRVITTFKHLATAEERQAELADMLGLGPDEGAHIAAEMLAAAHHTAAATAEVAAGIQAETAVQMEEDVAPAASRDVTGSREELCLQASSLGSYSSRDSSESVPVQQLSSSAAAHENNSTYGVQTPASHSSSSSSSSSSDSSTANANSSQASATTSKWLEGLSAAAAAAGVAAENETAAHQHDSTAGSGNSSS